MTKLGSLIFKRQDFFITRLGLFYWDEKIVLRQNSLDTIEKLSFPRLRFFKCEHELLLPTRFKHNEPHLKLTFKEQEILRKEFTKNLINNVSGSVETGEEIWIVSLPDSIIPVVVAGPKVVSTRVGEFVDLLRLGADDSKIFCKLELLKILCLSGRGSGFVFVPVELNEEPGFEIAGQGKEPSLPTFCDLAMFALDQKIVSDEAFLDSKFTAWEYMFLKIDKYQKLKIGGKLVRVAVFSSISAKLQEVLAKLPGRCQKPFLKSCERSGGLS